GISVQLSYQIFGILINVLTVLISYLVFRKLFDNVYTGLLGAALYSMSVYRMFLLYSEAELGESIALIFVPLIIYAVGMMLYRDAQDRDPRAWICLALGLTGILHAHLLTFVLVVCALIVVWVINIGRLKSAEVWKHLGFAIGLFVLCNLSYVYVLRLYLGVHAQVHPGTGSDIQTLGLQVAQLFMCFYQAGSSRDFGGSGVNNAAPVGLGFVMLVILLLFLYLVVVYGKELAGQKKRAGLQLFWVGLIATYFSTLLFPWDALRRSAPGLEVAIGDLQAPWHFLSIALTLFAVLGCIVYELLRTQFPEYYRIGGVALFLLTVLSSSYALANMLFVYDFSRIKMTEEIVYEGIAQAGAIDAAAAGPLWYIMEALSIIAVIFGIVCLVKRGGANAAKEEQQ
ncbi:MAG: glycosyltransferase family 39 protein, partial [Lachnospiraceae bacterium]|nr:glycosyltransferase family 39 protein [Lachnospiraceae bacterium]